ncbi:hypothetical protein [Mucilaginibacter ginsenosidivorax]|uniref:Uncharacterized protein n=1 Tax=Mucilaginibacter ginsenosidivorax TaxID=862126 RepID=A0A5B8W681_9SPHI|nr:hypothetical protein [Mucilaginibacter ginsenosidivorax]QEC79109.1 hypothetical protein FSB76_25310 [Mucilaginibacter ginsenosidivorax]
MQPDIEQLKTTYKNLSDDKLTHLAITEAASLRPEALDLLKAEIKNRGLDEGIMNGVNVQLSTPGSLAIDSYISLIRNQPCPVCSSTAQPLNAIVIGSVKSFIILTQYKKKLMIACPSCLQQANQRATSSTALMGWWGLPWGIIRTSQALFRNMKANKIIRTEEPSDNLVSFVKTNVGVIESVRKNNHSLQVMLDSVNKR